MHKIKTKKENGYLKMKDVRKLEIIQNCQHTAKGVEPHLNKLGRAINDKANTSETQNQYEIMEN